MIQAPSNDFTRAQVTGSSLAKLARPQNILYGCSLAFGCTLIAGGSIAAAIICVMLLFSLYALAAAYNNLQDIETDKINKRIDNPLVKGAVPRNVLHGFFIINTVVVVVLQSFLAQPASIILTICYGFLLYAYSSPLIRLQARGFIAIFTLAICYGGIPLALGSAQGSTPFTHMLFLFGLQIVLLSPLLLAKDYKDIEGDKATGKRTPLVRYGSNIVQIAAYGIAAFASVVYAAMIWSDSIRNIAVLLIIACYLLLTHYVHYKKGATQWWQSRMYVVVLLVISLSATATLLP